MVRYNDYSKMQSKLSAIDAEVKSTNNVKWLKKRRKELYGISIWLISEEHLTWRKELLGIIKEKLNAEQQKLLAKRRVEMNNEVSKIIHYLENQLVLANEKLNATKEPDNEDQTNYLLCLGKRNMLREVLQNIKERKYEDQINKHS